MKKSASSLTQHASRFAQRVQSHIASLCSGTVSVLSARPQRSAVTNFTHLCPRFAQRVQSHIASLCSGLLLRDFVPRRPSKVCAIAACSSQPSSCSAQHAPRFAQRVQSHIASLCSGASANACSCGAQALPCAPTSPSFSSSALLNANRLGAPATACSCGYFAKIYSYFRKFSSIILRRSGKVSLENVKAHRFNIFFTAPHTAKAFTMAEAIIVMTILGIIATIMITNLKIAEYRDKGLQIQAKKVLEQLDQATQHILINDSFDGKMSQLYDKNKNLFSFKDDCAKGVELYKKYLTTKRMPDFTPRYIAASHANYYIDDAYSRYHEYFFLKDGAFVGFLCATNEVGQGLSTWYPFDNSSEMGTYAGTYVLITKYVLQARLIIDVNGVEEPNIMGKDVFKLPLGDIGILYDPE